jgi:hypothetical protein
MPPFLNNSQKNKKNIIFDVSLLGIEFPIFEFIVS